MPVAVVVQQDAAEEVERIDAWWRDHRETAPSLFASELAGALALLAAAPQLGRRYPRRGITDCRRLLLRKCHFHVYYAYDGRTVTVLAVRSCLRGRGPDLPKR